MRYINLHLHYITLLDICVYSQCSSATVVGVTCMDGGWSFSAINYVATSVVPLHKLTKHHLFLYKRGSTGTQTHMC